MRSWTDDAGFINQPNLYVLDSSGVPISSDPSHPLTATPVKYSEDGVNSYEYRTARVSALWKPSDEFKAQLSYYYQVASAGGFPYVATSSLAYNQPIAQPPGVPRRSCTMRPVPPGVDRLSSATNSLENTKDHVDVTALTVDYDLGFATLTSSSSAAHHNNQTNYDLTALYTNFSFYKPYYGENPRSFIQGHDHLGRQSVRGGAASGVQDRRDVRLDRAVFSTRTRRPTSKSTSSIPAITTSTTLASPPIPTATAGSANM